ncbi:MAG TPA: hypothetical protein VEQ63_13220, partial [Bryobacteraceae bacterium]|nr:hypothetical protein [Bryobacteraceae bacterium]
FAQIHLVDDGDKTNPLWEPVRMARDAGRTQPFNPGMGHFICLDGFGSPSAEERKAGMMFHGEAHRQIYKTLPSTAGGQGISVSLTASLPLAQESFTRTIRLTPGENVVLVESELESLVSFDRPISWAEHGTVGAPFLEPLETIVNLSGTRSRTRPYDRVAEGGMQRRVASAREFNYPLAPGLEGGEIDMRVVPANPRYRDHYATLVSKDRPYGWITALQRKKRLILGYIFSNTDFPWVQHWGDYPPSGTLARGLEFSTQPFDIPRRDAVTMSSLFETPTYRWLPAKSKITTRFLMFYARVPEGLQNVDDVRFEGGNIVVEDRSAKRTLTLKSTFNVNVP